MPRKRRKKTSESHSPSQQPTVTTRRKRKKLIINWVPVLILILSVALVTGYLYSPITNIRLTRVVGAKSWDENRLRKIIEKLDFLPTRQVSAFKLESDVLALDAVRSAKFEPGYLGSARLTLSYRVPVAAIVGFKGAYLDTEGRIFGLTQYISELPRLKLSRSQAVTMISLAMSADIKRYSELAVLVQRLPTTETPEIIIEESGVVRINCLSTRIILGTCDDLEQKLSVLNRLILEKPSLFKTSSEINLMFPDAPMAVPKTSSKKNGGRKT